MAGERIITVPGEVVKVVDGDTIRVRVDLGWGVELKTDVRVAGINAPETSTVAGKAAKAFAQTLLPVAAPVLIKSFGLLGSTEKYGRILGDVGTAEGDFASAMVAANQAVKWDGHGPRPGG